MLHAVGYARLSDKKEASSSIPSQKRRIQEYCDHHGIQLEQIFTDDGKSGWTFDRPGFKELEKFCRANKKVSLLIIPHFDRFSRADPVDAMVKDRYFRDKLGVKVLQVTEHPSTNTEDSMFQLMRFMQAFAANEERNRIVDRIKNGYRYRASQGRYTGRPPFGYKMVKAEGKITEMVIDEERVEPVKAVFYSFLSGTPIEQIRKIAREKGYNGQGNSVIQKMLVNPLYAGLVQVPAYKDMPAKLVQGVHTAIITEQQYWEIQQRLAEGKRTHEIREEVPLRGVLKCYICGRPMTAAPSKGRHGKWYWYYFCNNDRKWNFSAKKLHDQLRQILESISITGPAYDKLKTRISSELNKRVSSQTRELMQVDLQLQKAERSLLKLEERYLLNPDISQEAYKNVVSEKRAEISVLTERRRLLNTNAADFLSKLDYYLQKSASLYTVYESFDLAGKQNFLRQGFGWNLSYFGGSYRTPFLLPIFMLKGPLEEGLPLIIENKKPPEGGFKGAVARRGIEPLFSE